MKQIQKASVCGLGKLGACIAATLAARGVEVVGVDIDAEKVRKVNDGLAPVEEPHLPETIREAGGRLRATQDYRQAVGTDVSFFIPPSPSLPDGSFSNEYLLRAMQPVAAAVREQGKKGHLFVCSSTICSRALPSIVPGSPHVGQRHATVSPWARRWSRGCMTRTCVNCVKQD